MEIAEKLKSELFEESKYKFIKNKQIIDVFGRKIPPIHVNKHTLLIYVLNIYIY